MKIILLTKPPIAGYAKTRLIDPLTAEQAAAVHAAMVRCTTRRLVTAFGGGDGHDLVLACLDGLYAVFQVVSGSVASFKEGGD